MQASLILLAMFGVGLGAMALGNVLPSGPKGPSSIHLGSWATDGEAWLEAFRRGELVPNKGLPGAIDVPSLERFAVDLQEGAYPIGTVIRLRDLELDNHPNGYKGVYCYSFASRGHGVITHIISNGDFAGKVIDATPSMGHETMPGYTRFYRVQELIGVVERDLYGVSSPFALVLTRMLVERTLVRHPDVKWAS